MDWNRETNPLVNFSILGANLITLALRTRTTARSTPTLSTAIPRRCVPTSETKCSTVSCGTSTIGKYQFYKQDNSVYFVCTDTKPANAYVAACPEDYKMDTEGNCVLTCLREGRLPHEDNTKYYECIKTGANTYRGPSPATCPTGSTFDVASKRCVSL